MQAPSLRKIFSLQEASDITLRRVTNAVTKWYRDDLGVSGDEVSLDDLKKLDNMLGELVDSRVSGTLGVGKFGIRQHILATIEEWAEQRKIGLDLEDELKLASSLEGLIR